MTRQGTFSCTEFFPNHWLALWTHNADKSAYWTSPFDLLFLFFISLSAIPKCNPCLTSIPLAMMCDLLAGQKQRFWRVSSACRRCGAKSASSSSAPVSLRILCWPSSVNERLASSLSHRPRRLQPLLTDVALTPAALGTGTDKKAWRKLFWESQKWNKSEQKLKFQSWQQWKSFREGKSEIS